MSLSFYGSKRIENCTRTGRGIWTAACFRMRENLRALPTRSASIRAPSCPGRRTRRYRRGRSPPLSRRRCDRAARCSTCTATCPLLTHDPCRFFHRSRSVSRDSHDTWSTPLAARSFAPQSVADHDDRRNPSRACAPAFLVSVALSLENCAVLKHILRIAFLFVSLIYFLPSRLCGDSLVDFSATPSGSWAPREIVQRSRHLGRRRVVRKCSVLLRFSGFRTGKSRHASYEEAQPERIGKDIHVSVIFSIIRTIDVARDDCTSH